MVNDISVPLPAPNVNVENSTITDHQPFIHENNPIVSVSEGYQPKAPSSYLSMSVGDNRQFGLSDFQDPLFYQQPLHLHYNQSLPFEIGSEHETGDRIRVTNKFKLNEYRKPRSVTSQKHRIGKSKSISRSKKSKSKIVKTNEKKKKVSRRNLKERKQNTKRINRSRIQPLRSQKKKKLLKQRIGSKKRSVSKVNKNKSLTARKSNTTNNRMASTISNTQIASDKIKQQTNTSIFNPVRQSNGTQIINEIKQLLPTPNNRLIPEISSTTKVEQNSSKKSLRRSKLNARKLPRSKSKQRKRGGTKLNIRSPVHTTFKKNVQRYRNRRSTKRKIKFPRCTSRTLITMGTLNTNNENMIRPNDIQNDDIRTKISSSIFSLKNNLTPKQSTTPLRKNCAQLTSKNNNNRRTIKIKRQRNISVSKRKSKKSTRR